MVVVVPEVSGKSEGPPWPCSMAQRIRRRVSSTLSLIAASCCGIKAPPGGSPSIDIAHSLEVWSWGWNWHGITGVGRSVDERWEICHLNDKLVFGRSDNGCEKHEDDSLKFTDSLLAWYWRLATCSMRVHACGPMSSTCLWPAMVPQPSTCTSCGRPPRWLSRARICMPGSLH